MIDKEQVKNKCLGIINEKITCLQNILVDLQYSAANETKSTAGDKHETALAMLQIEQENTGRQLQVLLGQRLQLTQLDLSKSATNISKGSLVYTSKGIVFIAVGLGKLQMDQNVLLVISHASPLGALLMGKKIDESVTCNGVEYHINQIA